MRHIHIGIMVATLCTAWSLCHAEVIDLEGTVKAVDAKARTITIERKTPKGTKTLELEVNKKAGDLTGVKVGDRLAFSYDPDLELVTRIGNEVQAATQPQELADKASLASEGPGEREKEICREVCRKLEQEHFLEPRIDRDLTKKTLDAYLRSLDPWKLYLLQSDIDSFMKSAADLPAALKEGDATLAYTIYGRLIERVSARLPVIESLITEQHDFTRDETIEIKQASTQWASSESASKDNWRRRIKYDLLVGKMQGENEQTVKERLLRRYRSLATRWKQMSSDELLETFLSSLYSSVDGQSTYMSPQTLVNFEIGMRSQLDGIGAQLKGEDGLVSVVDLTPGGAAARDGRLKPGDRIVGVAQGSSSNFIDTQDMPLNDVVNLVRGQRGSVVRLKVVSTGGTVPKVYDITRSKIELKNAEITGDVFEVDRGANGSPRKVGLVRIPSFYLDMEAARRGDKDFKSSTKDCKALLEGFRRQNVECVVVDLRDNGGGVLPEVIKSVGLFIDRGRVLQIKQKDGKVGKYDDNEDGPSWPGPLLVLVNRQTAGGAELFAGAIQDHCRGIIVGDESTSGIATNMNVIPVAANKQLGAVKLLWALMYRPSGEGVQGKGIRSDVVLPSVSATLAKHSDADGKARIIDRLGRDGFTPANQDQGDVTRSLQKRSAARVGKEPKFQELEKLLRRLDARLQSSSVSLNQADFERLWNEGQLDGASLAGDATKGTHKSDFYLEEVFNIAGDLSDEMANK